MDCLTDLVSVSGNVNVTVFAESPLLGLGVDIDVDLRICVMGWLPEQLPMLDCQNALCAPVSLQIDSLLLSIGWLGIEFGPLENTLPLAASVETKRFSTDPCGVSSSPSSSRAILSSLRGNRVSIKIISLKILCLWIMYCRLTPCSD